MLIVYFQEKKRKLKFWRLKLHYRSLFFSFARCADDLRPLEVIDCKNVSSKYVGTIKATSYQRVQPVVFGAPADLNCERLAHEAEQEVLPPDGILAWLDEVIIAANGVIICRDGRVVSESLINTDLCERFGFFVRNRADGSLQTDQCGFAIGLRLHGIPHVLLKQSYDANYGHWLIECLPKLAILQNQADLSQCRFIISRFHGAMDRVYRDSLMCCGIRDDQIVGIGYDAVQVETLLYPLPLTNHPWVLSPVSVEFLEAIAKKINTGPAGPERIYISRNRTNTRRLINEELVINFLQELEFTIVYPEDMSFTEQVNFFSSAKMIIGNYGANLTNLVFSPRGIRLIALTTQYMQDDFFWNLVSLKGGQYTSIHGVAIAAKPDLHSDFQIDIDLFKSTVSACIHEV